MVYCVFVFHLKVFFNFSCDFFLLLWLFRIVLFNFLIFVISQISFYCYWFLILFYVVEYSLHDFNYFKLIVYGLTRGYSLQKVICVLEKNVYLLLFGRALYTYMSVLSSLFYRVIRGFYFLSNCVPICSTHYFKWGIVPNFYLLNCLFHLVLSVFASCILELCFQVYISAIYSWWIDTFTIKNVIYLS